MSRCDPGRTAGVSRDDRPSSTHYRRLRAPIRASTTGTTMARYRHALPQLGDDLFLTDGGIETTLIFNEGLELPDFAAFHLLRTADGTAALRKYFRTYADLAQRFGAGL